MRSAWLLLVWRRAVSVVADALLAVLLSAPGMYMAGYSLGRDTGYKRAVRDMGDAPEGGDQP
ncbi:hypothetical protein GS907_02970 [Rhodococcus hoagii]|nr:hypothetical protein [Prescottella equi]